VGLLRVTSPVMTASKTPEDTPKGESSQEAPADAAYGADEPVGVDGETYENTETGLAPGEYPKDMSGTFGYASDDPAPKAKKK
jgi:hypothetical protein